MGRPGDDIGRVRIPAMFAEPAPLRLKLVMSKDWPPVSPIKPVRLRIDAEGAAPKLSAGVAVQNR